MEVQLSPDQEALIRNAVATGRYRSVEDALEDALARWAEEERTRIELLAALDEGDADLESGNYRDYNEEMLPPLAVELKREARDIRDRERS